MFSESIFIGLLATYMAKYGKDAFNQGSNHHDAREKKTSHRSNDQHSVVATRECAVVICMIERASLTRIVRQSVVAVSRVIDAVSRHDTIAVAGVFVFARIAV
jgi:predicted histidine transporter YuiF (NhaC family)